jgi:hypothetical protein
MQLCQLQSCIFPPLHFYVILLVLLTRVTYSLMVHLHRSVFLWNITVTFWNIGVHIVTILYGTNPFKLACAPEVRDNQVFILAYY